jgi:predicted glycogen debranching enzyme
MPGWAFNLRGDWERASRLEWLETNGIGGFASSTACGAATRRYHGLLVAALHPPVGRFLLLSKLDERVTAAGRTFELGCNQFPGVVHPRGFEFLDTFRRDVFPQFEYSFGDVRLRKTIAAIDGENTTVILYEILEAVGEVSIELRPFIAARDYHSLTQANASIRREATFDNGTLVIRPYDGGPTLQLSVPQSTFHAGPDWYYRFEYAIERERGLEAHEDLFTPGTLLCSAHGGSRFAVVASTERAADRDGVKLIERERKRRETVMAKVLIDGPLARPLALAADQFIVRRGGGKTILAGYPWFTDWGRDAMIALPGLCLATGRADDARKILEQFASVISEGMLPNRFPDAGEDPEYNTADATLWFFVAAQKYFEATGDQEFARSFLPILRDIIRWHERGTRHNIHVDSDGLLLAGTAGDHLTWMDAKIGDWVVTPRNGKAVEINALWYNALCIVAAADPAFATRAARVRERFVEMFWNEQYGCLYDVIDGERRDPSIRPNQIFAISLPYPLLDSSRAERVLEVVERKLLTPVGLRTLPEDDPRFVPRAVGSPRERDAAYHQGTVWPWLLGPYITALVRVRGQRGVAEGRRLLAGLEAHLGEAGVGTISEIFDGGPPHAPRGCIGQAWSVGEVLRVLREDLRGNVA